MNVFIKLFFYSFIYCTFFAVFVLHSMSCCTNKIKAEKEILLYTVYNTVLFFVTNSLLISDSSLNLPTDVNLWWTNRLHFPSAPVAPHHSEAIYVHSGPQLSFPHVFNRQVRQCSSNRRRSTDQCRLRRRAFRRAARRKPSQTEVRQLRHHVTVQQDVGAAETYTDINVQTRC